MALASAELTYRLESFFLARLLPSSLLCGWKSYCFLFLCRLFTFWDISLLKKQHQRKWDFCHPGFLQNDIWILQLARVAEKFCFCVVSRKGAHGDYIAVSLVCAKSFHSVYISESHRLCIHKVKSFKEKLEVGVYSHYSCFTVRARSND